VKDAALYADAMALPVRQAAEAIRSAGPHVIVGSSFGAAVLLRLLHEAPVGGTPVVLLAGAGLRLTGYTVLPAGLPAVLVHGRQDEVVPVEDSRLLAASSPHAVFIEVHDDHRLTQTTESGLLGALVALAAARGRSL
jgi:alpha/beta superfamily hydrolase